MGILTANVTRLSGRKAGEGYAQTLLNTATVETISREAGKTGIWIQVESGEVRVRTDGSDPTSEVGEVLGAGFAERYDVSSLKVLETTGAATIQTWSE